MSGAKRSFNAAQRGVEGETMTEKELQEIEARIAELETQSDEYERQIKKMEEKKFQAESDIDDLEERVGTFRIRAA